MWINPLFDESHDAAIMRLVRSHPLATLVVTDPLRVSHMPLLLDQPGSGAVAPERPAAAADGSAEPASTGEALDLVGHIPWDDPVSQALAAGAEMLAIFQGEVSYVSPSWYALPGLPTYNFVVAHLTGRAEPMTEESDLRSHLADLIAHHEERKPDGGCPWQMDDAAQRRTTQLLPRIMGFRVRTTSAQLKAKLGQNRPVADQQEVARHLARSPRTEDRQIAERMAASARSRGERDGP